MPEGHTLHRLARDQQRLFGGGTVRASSPQGRFADGAARIDGATLIKAEAYGKHLFHRYDRADGIGGEILHVHLGLYGKFTTGAGEPPEPRGALRLRLTNDAEMNDSPTNDAATNDAPMKDRVWTDLRGPTACELMSPAEVEVVLARLGPDPLRRGSDPLLGFQRVTRSRTPIAALLMDQQVLAGVGNVYRAELLFRHRLHPFATGRGVPQELWLDMWADLVELMRAGVRSGRIVTIRPDDRPRRGRLTRAESVYVYRRAGEPCRVCGTEIRTEVLVGRNLFWCPSCQAP
ncbi:Fpg/Nei family DNA glycosylase [uncultured Jatrophihabitans sp.]|uniref:Fpg/Nei family DNA glycosylase n=1 Tax=uncultured Jatrophihabitans sp. TaxID=1610747 RepID=UPI0035C9DA8A